eukprot:g7211.t1
MSLKLTRAPRDETEKALLEWKRLDKIVEKGRENSKKQLDAEKNKNTRLNCILRQLSHKKMDWHGVPKPKPLPEIYNVKDFHFDKARHLRCLILDEDVHQGKIAKYLVERASHELYMPCNCEITNDVASFVAKIMKGTKKDGKEFNLLFIPMSIANLFGPHLMRSLFEYGMEIPVVLCAEKALNTHKKQVLDSAHLRITLNRDELESRTSRATRKPWTSFPLPFEKSKVSMLISSWWRPTCERLERNRLKRNRLKAERRKARGNGYLAEKQVEIDETLDGDELYGDDDIRNAFKRSSFGTSSKKLIEQKMAPGSSLPTAADICKRSASFVMRYPRINGLGVHGTIRTYASKQYNISGSVAPALKSRWEAETENNLRNLDALEMARLNSRQGITGVQSKPVMGEKMMQYLKHAKKSTQTAHVKRLQKKSFLLQSKKISNLLPAHGGHNSVSGVGLYHSAKKKREVDKDVVSQYNKMKVIDNACGLQPIHPLKGYAVSWDFQFDKGADQI